LTLDLFKVFMCCHIHLINCYHHHRRRHHHQHTVIIMLLYVGLTTSHLIVYFSCNFTQLGEFYGGRRLCKGKRADTIQTGGSCEERFSGIKSGDGNTHEGLAMCHSRHGPKR